jgi:hypothetical protein
MSVITVTAMNVRDLYLNDRYITGNAPAPHLYDVLTAWPDGEIAVMTVRAYQELAKPAGLVMLLDAPQLRKRLDGETLTDDEAERIATEINARLRDGGDAR